jgi:1,4-dihydroxy-2-naphthoyl-CoA synthase
MNDIVLLKEEENGVVTLTLNRPEVMNSFNFQLLHALKEQIESVRFNRDIRVVIITAAGEKAFCAGADLKERATLSPDQVKEFIFTIRNLFTSIEQLNKAVMLKSSSLPSAICLPPLSSSIRPSLLPSMALHLAVERSWLWPVIFGWPP